MIEPGTGLVVDEVVVKNSGGLPLPDGGGVRAYDFEGCSPRDANGELKVPPLAVGATTTLQGGLEILVDPMPQGAVGFKPYATPFNFALGGWMCARPYGTGVLASVGSEKTDLIFMNA